MNRETVFSASRQHRYVLWRDWSDLIHPDNGKFIAFIGLNPSIASETILDATCRRCIDYSKRWGYTAYAMLNLFAAVATLPSDMKKFADPIGPENDRYLLEIGNQADLLIAAWGNDGAYQGRGAQVASMFPGKLKALKLNTDKSPAHPLYLSKSLTPFPYPAART